MPLHQIAPLVVHAIKFGGGYVGGAEAAIAAVPPETRQAHPAEDGNVRAPRTGNVPMPTTAGGGR